MKRCIFVLVTILLVGCSTNKQQVQLIQENNHKQLIDIIFFKYDEYLKCSVILRKKIKLKNFYWNSCTVKINYYKKGFSEPEVFARPTEFNEKFNKFTNIISNEISISIKGEKEIVYEVWENIDSLDFTNKYYKSLEQYKNLVKPTDMSSVSPDRPINDDILSYEEPFSEFKRKNPELLEFLTKGDSIELEVLSPVKQKYKFKAEW